MLKQTFNTLNLNSVVIILTDMGRSELIFCINVQSGKDTILALRTTIQNRPKHSHFYVINSFLLNDLNDTAA